MKDYGRAWAQALLFAIKEKVDFVLIGGDLFDKKNPAPRAMIHAINGLNTLKENNIPAIAIEGNHDNVSNGKEYSWLHTLSEMRLLKLLESSIFSDENGVLQARMNPWDDENCKGQFIDIGDARIFGTSWHGASIEKLVPHFVEALTANRRENAFHILMLHTEIEGREISPFPLISMESLKKFKPVTDYLALGHIHKHFVIEDWAFNPGSLEITNISEFKDERGALLVEFAEDKKISYKLFKDYYQRPFKRLRFDVSGKTPDEVFTGVFEKMSREIDIKPNLKETERPIIEVIFEGYLGFKSGELEINKVRDEVRLKTNALHVLIKNQTVFRDEPVGLDIEESFDRRKIEKRVLTDLIFRDNRYKMIAEDFADVAITVKNKALNDDVPEEIVDFLALKLETENSSVQT